MRNQSRIPFRSLFRIKACNRLNDQLIGYVADVSATGLRLLSDTAMAPDSSTIIRLKIRVREDELLQLDVSLRCMWSRENQKTRRFESGFVLLEPSAEFARLVAELLTIRAKAR